MSDVTSAGPMKRRDIIDALRSGTVPPRGLELFAVGMERYAEAIDEELTTVATGRGRFKAVRGEYGTGKTFFSRWLEHRAREMGFATALVQISETETPLYRMETVYRRAVESMQTTAARRGAFRSIIDEWLYQLEEEVLEAGKVREDDLEAVAEVVGDLLEQRLSEVSKTHPQFATALRAIHIARVKGEGAVAESLVSWLMGSPNVGAAAKRVAGIKGEIDHFGAAGFFRGLLELLRLTGRKGLVLVLDEVETIQRVRADSKDRSLNALRQLLDDLSNERYPGLYVLITGTPAFFDGNQGVQRLGALAQRLQVDFPKNAEFDSTRAVQIRLQAFTREKLIEVGRRVRDLYPSDDSSRVAERVGDDIVAGLADGVAGKLGGKVGIAPRIFLKKLVGMLDQVHEHASFDPAVHYELVVDTRELDVTERAAMSVDDIELELP